MKDVKLDVGQLVCSIAGRDKGNLYLIWKMGDDNNLWVVDGVNRKVEKPKKKNIKHLKELPYFSGFINEKIKLGERVTNSDIQRSITEYRERNNEVI